MARPFKMKGMSFGNSPMKKKLPIDKSKDFDIDELLDDEKNLSEAKKKALAERKALYDAGKITKEKFESDKEEISRYIDY